MLVLLFAGTYANGYMESKHFDLFTEVKSILNTVEVKKPSVTVKNGKKTQIQLSSALDMDNVKSITYKTSKKSVASVSKSGKITTNKKGTATIKAIVTLKNGKKKTVSMTLKVK